MSESTNNQEQEVYLEPAVEINRAVVDPLGGQDDPENNNICPPGGC